MGKNRERAIERLGEAQRKSDLTDEQRAALRLEAVTYAVLAVADELGELRGAVANVEDALEDQSGFGVGSHLRHVADLVEKIADR
jgi:hypothetical protein